MGREQDEQATEEVTRLIQDVYHQDGICIRIPYSEMMPILI